MKETIDIAVNLIIEKEPQIKISKKELQTLFEFATSLSHFSFNGMIYDQTDGVAMGSPLGPVLANVFMGFHESKWISNYSNNNKPLYYARYVDDIFCLFHNEKDSEMFLNYLNDQHNNIRFTIEKETEGRLSFLDTKIDKTQGVKPSISIFKKSTFTGLMINYLSYNPFSYKLSVVKSMIHRIYSICNSENNIQSDLKNFKKIMNRNMFPKQIIGKEIENYLSKTNSVTTNEEKTLEKQISYFKLPYFENISEATIKKLRKIANDLCKKTDIRLSFSTCKIGSLFSAKDKLKDTLKSFVVYQFTCAGCNASYIGETTRHLTTRIDEHFSSQSSH